MPDGASHDHDRPPARMHAAVRGAREYVTAWGAPAAVGGRGAVEPASAGSTA